MLQASIIRHFEIWILRCVSFCSNFVTAHGQCFLTILKKLFTFLKLCQGLVEALLHKLLKSAHFRALKSGVMVSFWRIKTLFSGGALLRIIDKKLATFRSESTMPCVIKPVVVLKSSAGFTSVEDSISLASIFSSQDMKILFSPTHQKRCLRRILSYL